MPIASSGAEDGHIPLVQRMQRMSAELSKRFVQLGDSGRLAAAIAKKYGESAVRLHNQMRCEAYERRYRSRGRAMAKRAAGKKRGV